MSAQDVEDARAAVDLATTRLHSAIITAHRSGVSERALAEAAGLARMTVRKILAGQRQTDDFWSRDEVIQRHIIEPLVGSGEDPADYDLDAIAVATVRHYPTGYRMAVDEDEFWAAVQRHAR